VLDLGCGQGLLTAWLGATDAVVILDVLHYLAGASQQEVLKRVRAAAMPACRATGAANRHRTTRR
jgi:hypothetical protein